MVLPQLYAIFPLIHIQKLLFSRLYQAADESPSISETKPVLHLLTYYLPKPKLELYLNSIF